MKASRVSNVCAIAALLAGCDALQSPIGSSGAVLPLRAVASGPALNQKALPEPKGRNLFYASSDGDGPMSVYRFPGSRFVGVLSGPSGPRGLCADRAGDIFVPFIYIPGGVYEYAHGGGTPIAELGLLYSWPNGCSISPKTGALAVVAGPTPSGNRRSRPPSIPSNRTGNMPHNASRKISIGRSRISNRFMPISKGSPGASRTPSRCATRNTNGRGRSRRPLGPSDVEGAKNRA